MPIQPRETLRPFFEAGDQPTEAQYRDLLDSYFHKLDDAALVGLRNYNQQLGYPAGAVVVSAGKFYQAVQNVPVDADGSLGVAPPNASYWSLISGQIPIIDTADLAAATVTSALGARGLANGPIVALRSQANSTAPGGGSYRRVAFYYHSASQATADSPYIVNSNDSGSWVAWGGYYMAEIDAKLINVADLQATAATIGTATITTANITTGTVDDLRGAIGTGSPNLLEGAAFLSKSFRIGTGTGPFSYADGDLLVELPQDAWIIDMFIIVTTAFVKGTGATYNRIFFSNDPSGLNNQGMFDFGHGTGYDLTTAGRIHAGDGSHGTKLGVRTAPNNLVPKAEFANGNNQYGLFVKTNNGVAADFDDGRAEVIVWYAMPHA